MAKSWTIKQFLETYPDDDACLAHLFETRYSKEPVCPKCGQIGTFHKLKKLPAYTCNCGHHIHPMAGTPFWRSRTPLRTWFYVMFLFCATRNGLSAKEIQRQIGVTYKTAWRMGHEIRKYMGWVDGDSRLGGPGRPPVEIDKAFIGGRDKAGKGDKKIVLGMVERKGGDLITCVIPDRSRRSIWPHVAEWVRPGARVMTDEAPTLVNLGWDRYQHASVNHLAKEWVRGHAHTNTIEGFWGALKRGINGTYVWVSAKHLQKYLWEFEYRHNLRKEPWLMFQLLLHAFPRASQ
ncbi:MAG: IS1595 family transposase [Methyloceanibacter sp.]